nr:ADP-ribosylglycohydrolase family protein [Capnocytophaga haemolytica]
MGEDTDTIGAITGSLAGAIYGYTAIPKQWIVAIANEELIKMHCLALSNI